MATSIRYSDFDNDNNKSRFSLDLSESRSGKKYHSAAVLTLRQTGQHNSAKLSTVVVIFPEFPYTGLFRQFVSYIRKIICDTTGATYLVPSGS